MRILMLVQRPTARGPVPKHTAHLVTALRSLGCEVVTHPWGQHRMGESVVTKIVQRFRDVLSVRRALRGEKFDVAVVKTAHDWQTLLRDTAVVSVIRRRCRPIVLQFHGSQPTKLIEPGNGAFTAATALLLRLTDAVMVLSTEEKRQWQAFRPMLRTYTVKNPYVRSAGAAARRTSLGDHHPRVLFVGRLMEEKGIFDLLEAFAAVRRRLRCQLVIAGEGPDEPRLRGRVSALGLQDDVAFIGYVSGERLRNLYSKATFFAFPSRDEGFPTVLAEAMDAGLPIVTTRIRGAADHLIPEENALFVAPRDINALTSAMLRLCLEPDLRDRMAASNRQRVRIFEPEIVAGEYLNVLRDAISATSSPNRSPTPPTSNVSTQADPGPVVKPRPGRRT
jgi:glycosyltransferase involved in cell wall biosynthesis